MESTTSYVIVSYYPDIARVVESFSGPMNFAAVIDKLCDVIVDNYNGDVFANYKRKWIGTVVEYFKTKQIDLPRTPKPNWDNISAAIIDRLVEKNYDFQQKSVSAVSRSSASVSRRSSSTVPSVDNSDATSNKISKLTPIDKDNIRIMYDGLDRKKMWKLSTGTIVEDKMRDVALDLENEHPCHSLILDITDSCWRDVFTSNERDEIRNFQSVEMPSLPVEADNYLQQLNIADHGELYVKVKSDDFMIEADCNWIQKSYRDAYRLLRSDFFPLNNQTEGNVVKRVWSCVDTCFDFSGIKSVSGEKCSRASADAGNRGRSVSDVGRQFAGRKMDYLFTTRKTEYEVGCGECALVGGVNTTKELQDASFKMPKVMKDMANSIFTTHPALIHDLSIVGYYIGENAIRLLTLDFPAGYVARLDGFGPVFFPKAESEINHALPRVLKLVMAGRQMMEASKMAIEEYKVTEPIGRNGVIYAQIVPTFMSIATQVKKRKVHNEL